MSDEPFSERRRDQPAEGRGGSPAAGVPPQQLFREILTLREWMVERIEREQSANDAHFEGNARAVALLQVILDRIPHDIDTKVDHLRGLHEEKFKSIQVQFTERDVRTEQTSRDSKVAVDAALQAAKEAVEKQNTSSALAIGKSETATTKLLENLGQQMGLSTSGLNDKIDDVKERLTRLESEDRGKQSAVVTQQSNSSNILTLIGIAIAAVAGIGGLIVSLARHV